MVSEFRKKKLLHVYNFFDADSSGSIDKNDFQVSVDNIANYQQWAKDSAKYKEAQEALANVWDSLQKEADKDDDGKVTVDEWFNMWEEFAKNPSSPFEWQSLYCKFVFDLEDASGDGAIDGEEFSSVLQLFGVTKEAADTAFQKISKGAPSVSWEDFQELWKEYFTSENTSEAGNFIFGAPTF